MSEQFTWELLVTDAHGRQQAVPDEGFVNPYVSEQTAQQVAEQVLAQLASSYTGQTPQPQAVEVGVWLGTRGGDPIATARWTPGD